MRLMLFGSGGFVVPVFESLRLEHTVVGLFTREPKPVGRKQVLTPTPTQVWADAHNIPVHYKLEEFTGQGIDFCVVMSYGVILPDDVIAKSTFLNVHPSDLPTYRGPSPIRTALRNGDIHSAVCIIKLVEQVDAGDVFIREGFDIEPNDTNKTVQKKVATITTGLLQKFLSNPAAYPPIPQEGEVIITHRTTKEDRTVDLNTMSAQEIHNRVRAYDAVLTTIGDTEVKLLQTEVTADHKLRILRIQPCGKKEMDWKTFFNGHHDIPDLVSK